MNVTRIATTRDLEQLVPDWNCLAGGVPFRTWQWLLNWWRYYGQGKNLYALAVHDGAGVLVGLAPWFSEERRGDGRVVQFLGSGSVCTDYLSVLSTPEHAPQVVRALVDWLVAAAEDNGADRWDLLDFDGIPLEDGTMSNLVRGLHQAGCRFSRRPAMDCWRLTLPTNPETFFDGLKKSHAKKVRKVRRRLFESGRGVVRTVRRPEELEAGMQVLVDLHQRRWNHLGIPGCFASDLFREFLFAAAGDLLDAGMLNLSWLDIDGEPAVAEFLLCTTSRMYAYQSGLHPRARTHSPGHAIMSTVIAGAIESGCRQIDFLRGDEPYKATWGAEPVTTERIRIAPGRIGPLLRNQAWHAGQVMKGWVKQGLTLTGVH